MSASRELVAEIDHFFDTGESVYVGCLYALDADLLYSPHYFANVSIKQQVKPRLIAENNSGED